VGDFFGPGGGVEERRVRAGLLFGPHALDDETVPFWNLAPSAFSRAILERLDGMADLSRVESFLHELAENTVQELNVQTLRELGARATLAKALVDANVNPYWMKRASSYLPASPRERELDGARDLVKTCLYLDAACANDGCHLLPFLKASVEGSNPGVAEVDRIRDSAVRLARLLDPDLPPDAWDRAETRVAERGVRDEGPPTVAVVFLTEGGELGASLRQVPGHILVRWRLSPQAPFEFPGFAPTAAGLAEAFGMRVDDLSAESLAAVYDWLPGCLHRAFEAIEAAGGDNGETRVEFFLPLSLLHEPFHTLAMGGTGFPVALWESLHAVVRSLERCKLRPLREQTLKRIQSTPFSVGWHSGSGGTPPTAEDLCIVFTHEIDPEGEGGQAILQAIKAKTPYLCWMNGPSGDPPRCFRDLVAPPFAPTCAPELLEQVQSARTRLGNDAARVTLLFECAGTLPPFDHVSYADQSQRNP